MISIKQAAKRHLEEPLLLPDLFNCLKKEGIRFRRGQVTMIAGQPNSGKSLFALFYGVKAKVPTLYISADTDAYTTAIRTAAILTTHETTTIEESFKNTGVELYTDALTNLRHIEFSFDPSPTLDDIDLMIKAYGEKYGEYPHLIIIDNLMNVTALHDNEWTGMRDIMKAAHHIARETESAVFVLHHTSEAEGDPDRPPARRAIQGKVSQLPEMILTVAMETEQSELRIACVKNRFAKHSARGDQWVPLRVDASRMTVREEDIMDRQLYINGVVRNVSEEQAQGF
jgi:KaiC/GvpD/RAD55 family RecA-like ATPase